MKPSLFRSVYGGGPKGGRWSDDFKIKTIRRLVRMLVRVVWGPHKVREFDAMADRFEALTPAEKEADIRRQKDIMKAMLERDEF